MTPRSFWKGYLKLSLVTCPVAMTPAVTDSEKVHFHMVTKLIEERTKSWEPDMVSDPVQQQLLQLIAARKKGKRAPKPKPAPELPSNVVNIMDALRRSLQAERKPSGR